MERQAGRNQKTKGYSECTRLMITHKDVDVYSFICLNQMVSGGGGGKEEEAWA